MKKKISVSKTSPYHGLVIAVSKINTDEINKHEQGRTISVHDLPDCDHKSRLLMIVQNPKEASIVVIALNKQGIWRGYAGYPDVRDLRPIIKDFNYDIEWFCENIRDRNQVLMMGDKLPAKVLPLIFTDIKLEDCK